MIELPESINNCVAFFKKLPGVGEKTAIRQVLFLAGLDMRDLAAFGDALRALAEIKKCQVCGMLSDNDLCKICSDHGRFASKTICVVENINDCIAIEKSGNYHGKFHVLGGVLNPLLGQGPDEINLDRLKERIVAEQVEEIILAINPTVEGDATCSYIKQFLPESIEIDRIGFGMPIGGSLEYLDAMTITKALENRKKI
ncbi:MAG: recombination protein RecR [Bdellovibrionales bacterium RIFOXYD12_FULL_39_22]|nr:MAG: recombination protein RecR [Bdellovibrionales bacterium RIFOXYB1_FULL_39_21]OFZ41391.1 MAG: recombination protein RecR [Bdellovibrionales bacterium RIFOXYC12_FULL_39_17]OFZ45346.1 MAG: recombination protein RecR [Bdellovibrionales bacterium RIFOXYC1_FULL_39_130]OFZ68782.1 MAG: recombination protein RecR [Bdellovibrionales bacterium RIFOXYC2_FULL_39_8]OFZ74542.1 MAG: recombination protein RecR [Bdellovibrionales bacterium RIFOXYD1_FULL_39_84]OFZ92551.1 MAG: recombination protein RecR [B